MDYTTELARPDTAAEDALQNTDGIAERLCEICNTAVSSDERHEILRAGGPVWRHPGHTEPVG